MNLLSIDDHKKLPHEKLGARIWGPQRHLHREITFVRSSHGGSNLRNFLALGASKKFLVIKSLPHQN